MRLRISFLLASVLLSSPAPGGEAAAGEDRMERRDPLARPAETAAAAAWSRERLAGPAAAAPFIFIYDGRPSGGLLGSWERRETVRELDPGRTERTISYRDPSTGLVCTCRWIAFRDAPAIDRKLEHTCMGRTSIRARLDGNPAG